MKAQWLFRFAAFVCLSSCYDPAGLMPTSHSLRIVAVRAPEVAKVDERVIVQVDVTGDGCQEGMISTVGSNPNQCESGGTERDYWVSAKTFGGAPCDSAKTLELCFIPTNSGRLSFKFINSEMAEVAVQVMP